LAVILIQFIYISLSTGRSITILAIINSNDKWLQSGLNIFESNIAREPRTNANILQVCKLLTSSVPEHHRNYSNVRWYKQKILEHFYFKLPFKSILNISSINKWAACWQLSVWKLFLNVIKRCVLNIINNKQFINK
jgi:hypothetical protein